MATAIHNRAVITREELHSSKEWRSLTERQQRWVDAFIGSQDAAQATMTAYSVGGTPYAAMLTAKVQSSRRVLDCLDLYFGLSLREKFLRDLTLDISHSKNGIAKVEARRLYAKMAFGIDGSPSAESEHPACKIGDIVLVDGVKYRVTAVDPSGRPTDGEPL